MTTMSFDLNSSSSDLENPIELRRVAQDSASDDDSDSVSGRVHQQIDEELVESIRSALHLAVGNICREQDAAADATDNNSSFITSNGAIAALTDLVSICAVYCGFIFRNSHSLLLRFCLTHFRHFTTALRYSQMIWYPSPRMQDEK